MAIDPTKGNRKSVPLKGYDYGSPGAYFVTICVHKGSCLFGNVKEGRVSLSEFGQIVEIEWRSTGNKREYVELDAYTIMPNHFHGVLILLNSASRNKAAGTVPRDRTGERYGSPVVGSIPSIVRGFKSSVTKSINEVRSTPGSKVWQRGFY